MPSTPSTELRDLQALVSRLWSPDAHLHIGDLAWGLRSNPADGRTVRIWRDHAGTPAAWGVLEQPAHLLMAVDPACADLAGEVLDWAEDAAGGRVSCAVHETEGHLIAALADAGYAEHPGQPYFRHHHIALAHLPEPVLPDGFRLRHVEPGEAGARAGAHRAAWSDAAPSRMTTERYAEVMAAWPYDHELDWVAEAPDGRIAATTLAWLDADNRCGLLEPVGCAPEFRRLGLSRATGFAALRALRDKGADLGVVCPRGDDAYPVPQRLYQSMGFVPRGRTVTYRCTRRD